MSTRTLLSLAHMARPEADMAVPMVPMRKSFLRPILSAILPPPAVPMILAM